MPHCVIEYSHNLEQILPPLTLMETVKQACIASNLFSPEDVKVRAFPYQHFLAAGSEEYFIHVTLKMLSGRRIEQKECVSRMILQTLTQLALKNAGLTVEICDIDKASYAKKVFIS
ncbi:5-carboxymethyl-2-hydroxymuconate Delta-isomerase [Marinomonas sp.]|nr:5-carboxymethyl-2-hydroxymuconate Delta-isomerase [Marinomonas sp.]MDB4837945.1 5-carboxymethyl-2-hydroxymuconate Delta-isomerase [Marinomonas sp.]